MQFEVMVSDENLPRDGKLDVVVLKTENAFQLLPIVMAKVFDHSGALAKKLEDLNSTAVPTFVLKQIPECRFNTTASQQTFKHP